MFCHVDKEALSAAVVAVGALALCFLAHTAMLHGSLSARRQTALTDAWCMSVALAEVDMVHAQSPLAVRK
jgi:hypothetical protein